MRVRRLHRWDLSPRAAAELQKRLASKVRREPPLAGFRLVAGTDVAFRKADRTICAGVVVIDISTGQIVEQAAAVCPETFPYVPGLLSFREIPALLQALHSIRTRPDVVIADGQGVAHPRRFGLASHLGLCLGLPTIGCAKSRLVGESRGPAMARGSRAALKEGRETIGMVVRTRAGVKPVWVSVGHLIDLPSAVRVVLRSTRGYRLPEPARRAHQYVTSLHHRPRPAR
jgi:deoxyribonuclease V